ncbi:hypothetical protein DAPPUDRAFT_116882 [Daphnia pulex]|uniref:Cullin family profile domain-containing protein n=1 Tax=Daphnia pulex TaxID=6669 RepID=E9HQV0_DAPPU|nr:hypothetical protein DAPPUDRAFT_116882 [Daphnia pulex]|eukprot:EFX65885.1 hypothetical protein DAPPUDRAFT_116882 [Daphnia pulex]
MVSQLTDHIKQQGLRGVTNLSGRNIPIEFVESILNVQSKYKEIIKTVFSNDTLFKSALDRTCSAVVNHQVNIQCKTPEMLAKCVDFLLKKSSKDGSADTKLDEKLSQCVTVFDYIDDKDIAEKWTVQSLVDEKLLLANQQVFNHQQKFPSTCFLATKDPKFVLRAVRKSVQEHEPIYSSIIKERTVYLEATIVRIMKAKKKLRHDVLMQEVLNESKARFIASITLIKKCIAKLIDKEYLARKMDEYAYVA